MKFRVLVVLYCIPWKCPLKPCEFSFNIHVVFWLTFVPYTLDILCITTDQIWKAYATFVYVETKNSHMTTQKYLVTWSKENCHMTKEHYHPTIIKHCHMTTTKHCHMTIKHYHMTTEEHCHMTTEYYCMTIIKQSHDNRILLHCHMKQKNYFTWQQQTLSHDNRILHCHMWKENWCNIFAKVFLILNQKNWFLRTYTILYVTL